jgi:hypothetical protein
MVPSIHADAHRGCLDAHTIFFMHPPEDCAGTMVHVVQVPGSLDPSAQENSVMTLGISW